MNIMITGRHISVSQRLREYAEKKIKKLEKYFNQLINAHVILFVEKLDHAAEVIINGDGVQFHGREKAGTLYSAIDLLFEKMEKQIVKYKEKVSGHKASGIGQSIEFPITNEAGREIQMVQVSNKPIDRVEAFLQMENDKKDYILFKQGISEVDSQVDLSNKSYAVMFREEEGLKMVEVPLDHIKDQVYEHDTLVEYNVNVEDGSIANPKLKFSKNDGCCIPMMNLDQAMNSLDESGAKFLSFFNVDAQYFNILYKTSGKYEVLVPAF